MIALTPSRVARVFMACKGKPLMLSRAADKVARLAEQHEALGRQLHYLADALHEQRHVELARRAGDTETMREHRAIRDNYLRRLEP
jgi:hypothetical protein